jgi:dihydroneopterin aldolase
VDKTTDTLVLKGIQVETLIGLLAEERKARQSLSVDVVLTLDFAPAIEKDLLETVVNYADVVQYVRDFGARRSDNTLERFAHFLALDLRKAFPKIQKVAIRVAKPRYTGPLGLDSIEVHVER